jgi:hypothetical protein
MLRSFHPSQFHYPKNLYGEEYNHEACRYAIFSVLLGPNIFLSTLLSNTFSLSCSLNVRDLVLHLYTTATVTVVRSEVSIADFLRFQIAEI